MSHTTQASDPIVVIGAPVRNRAWVLPFYLQRIYDLDYPKDKIILLFLINDCTDNSQEILLRFQAAHAPEYRDIILLQHDMNQIPDERIRLTRDAIFHSLAILRNIMLIYAAQADYYFNVDTDILIPPDALQLLLGCNKDIVSALIWNDITKTYPNILVKRSDNIIHWINPPENALIPCDVTGAVCLMTREVCKKVRFAYHFQGEDVSFCLDAKKLGFEIWSYTRVKADHLYMKEWLEEIKPNIDKDLLAPEPGDTAVQPVSPAVVLEATEAAQKGYREPPTTQFITLGIKANGKPFIQSQGDPIILEGLLRVGRQFLDSQWAQLNALPPSLSPSTNPNRQPPPPG